MPKCRPQFQQLELLWRRPEIWSLQVGKNKNRMKRNGGGLRESQSRNIFTKRICFKSMDSRFFEKYKEKAVLISLHPQTLWSSLSGKFYLLKSKSHPEASNIDLSTPIRPSQGWSLCEPAQFKSIMTQAFVFRECVFFPKIMWQLISHQSAQLSERVYSPKHTREFWVSVTQSFTPEATIRRICRENETRREACKSEACVYRFFSYLLMLVFYSEFLTDVKDSPICSGSETKTICITIRRKMRVKAGKKKKNDDGKQEVIDKGKEFRKTKS